VLSGTVCTWWWGGWPRKEEGGGKMAAVATALQAEETQRLLHVVQLE
jgi:hypothetical protein